MNAPRLGQKHLLALLSIASDLGIGMPQEHGLRACYIGMHIAGSLGLTAGQLDEVCCGLLLKDAGCTAWATQVAAFLGTDGIAARRDLLFDHPTTSSEEMSWVLKHLGEGDHIPSRALRFSRVMLNGRDFDREGFMSAGNVACRIAERMGTTALTQRSLRSTFEHWDGHGMPYGLKGEDIPLISRIIFLASYAEVAHRTGGRGAAVRLAREHRGKRFDPTIVEAFEDLATKEVFWIGLEEESIWPFLLDNTSGSEAPAPALEDFASCCADYVDMKSFWLTGHSRRVAEQVERLCKLLRLSDRETFDLRIAALVHDLGLVGVPSFVINKPAGRLSQDDRAVFQQHTHHTLDLLSRFEELSRIADIAAAHHERLDGSGYHRGLRNIEISLAAGLVGAAARFDELSRGGPGAPPLDPEQALNELHTGPGGFAIEVVEAMRFDVLRKPELLPEQTWPAGLTDREVEVLRLAGTGLTRGQIAKKLVISESTVRSHLEHIYTKTNSTTRVGAVLFAIENGLIV